MNDFNKSEFAILKKIKRPLEIKTLKIPEPSKNQILVKVMYSYVCGTQLNEINGRKGKDKYLPHTLGHEASGKVLKIGTNVKKFRIGESVILSWIKKNMTDDKSANYHDLKGEKINSGHVSTFSKLTLVAQSRVYKTPKKLPLDIAALLGCAIPTGFGVALKYFSKFNKNDYVGVYGVGGVGLMSVMALKALGFKNIYAVDQNKKNLTTAKRFGCKKIYNFNILKDENKFNIEINKEKIKFNIELSGSKEMMQHAYKNLSKDGTFVLAGNTKVGQKIKINPYDLIFGKKIHGFSGNDVSLEGNINIYSKIIKKIGFSKIRRLYKTYSFKNINIAINDFNKRKVLRPLIKF
jgi:S-(hydroxymethyl)glutathione dehydrogenase/alcohol dehydrogenase